MMYSSLEAVAAAIGTLAYGNEQSQLSTSFCLLAVILAKFPLMAAWMKQLQDDTNTYNYDVEESIVTKSYSVAAAAESEQKTIDSSNSDVEQGRQDNIIQSQQSLMQVQGNAMSNTYQLESPIMQLMEFITGSIMGIPKG